MNCEQLNRWTIHIGSCVTLNFKYFKLGRFKPKAFAVGAEIAASITEMNPYPIYYPCVLQMKKTLRRLFVSQSVDQMAPTFDAKGIETVRRILALPFLNENVFPQILEKSLETTSAASLFKLAASDI
ncbi:DNA polymerase zeta catalytic subunit [Trichinella nelsoni]|uniref:DNA polymerase zeta catalytic subunit n=1 Tax=Trichinella nelsoni TaxID=6336 RepID=A0A0V0RH64_9BILA|nr:DNA polymerase zeta catalytic subunit [Trichinella nelsoni]